MVKLDPHGEELMRQFHELRPTLDQLANDAFELLSNALRDQGVYVTAMEHRVKTEKSLAGKLELKGAKYKSIVLPNDTEEVPKLTAFVDEVCETLGFNPSTTHLRHRLGREC